DPVAPAKTIDHVVVEPMIPRVLEKLLRIILKRRIVRVVKRDHVAFRNVIHDPGWHAAQFPLLPRRAQTIQIEAIVVSLVALGLELGQHSRAVAVELVAVSLLRKPYLVERQSRFGPDRRYR